MRLLTVVFVAGSFLILFPSSASGQSVLVQVTGTETGNPLPGAFVSLLDEEGVVMRSALTNEAGAFLFPVSRLGKFRVKAELIGRRTQVSSSFTLREGEPARIPLSLSLYAIPLTEIRVEADERCKLRPDEATRIAQVWEAARTSLTVQAWTEQQGLYRLDISSLRSGPRRVGAQGAAGEPS